MGSQINHFLVFLSHGGSVLLLPPAVVLWGGAVLARRQRDRAAVAGDPLAATLASGMRWACGGLLVADLTLLLTSFLHIGCAGTKAQESTCLVHLKQLGLAALLYAADADEAMPPVEMRGRSGALVGDWRTMTLPYAHASAELYGCPESPWAVAHIHAEGNADRLPGTSASPRDADCSPHSPTFTADPDCRLGGAVRLPRAYVMNGAVFNHALHTGGARATGRQQTQSRLAQPGETAMILHMRVYAAASDPEQTSRCGGSPMGVASSEYADPAAPLGRRRSRSWWIAHGSPGLALTFADGHTSWLRMDRLIAENLLKHDCQRLPTDETTWPQNRFSPDRCWSSASAAACRDMAIRIADDEVRTVAR